MNNGKLWTVVNPTVGIPLFLGGVITVSLIVHFAVLTNTTWYPAFFGG
ncbi:MAG: light-harvesting protein [Halieaceae bacterium]|nr:light-harvesting protein [Halieaceae bacterium]